MPAARRPLLPWLVAALVVVPLVELYVLIQVGQAIGALWTVLLLVVVSVLGAALLRREGARTWRSFVTASQSGRVPAREVADGALVMLAGALLLTPGFASDALGLVLLLPPVRALLRMRLSTWVGRQLVARVVGQGPPRGRGRGRGSVVDGEVVDEPRDGPGEALGR